MNLMLVKYKSDKLIFLVDAESVEDAINIAINHNCIEMVEEDMDGFCKGYNSGDEKNKDNYSIEELSFKMLHDIMDSYSDAIYYTSRNAIVLDGNIIN